MHVNRCVCSYLPHASECHPPSPPNSVQSDKEGHEAPGSPNKRPHFSPTPPMNNSIARWRTQGNSRNWLAMTICLYTAVSGC